MSKESSISLFGSWTIADYKTDVGTDPDFEERKVAYRRQVEMYAAC